MSRNLEARHAEDPYRTIKSSIGATHLKTRTLKTVATEMALHVLANNMTCVMKIMGIPAMMAALKERDLICSEIYAQYALSVSR